MKSFLRELAVLPLKIVLAVMRLLRISSAVQLIFVRWIWKIGHETEYARLYLIFLWFIKGEEETRDIAEKILLKEKDAHIAYFMGRLEFDAKKDAHKAKQWIQKAEEIDCCHSEVLLYLKLYMSRIVPEYDDDSLIQKILDRNDLSMEETRFALLMRAWRYIQHKNWIDADRILDEMLRIESDCKIHVYKWITSLAKDESALAQKHLAAAEKMCDKEYLYIEQAVGFYWLGKLDKAREFLNKGIRDEEHRRAILFFQPYLAELLKNDNLS